MARMLPRLVAEHTVSDAERRMFRRIREDLSDEWWVIHSLGMTTHARKPWAEIDFVLIGPPGVYCLEVKGGAIGRTDGRWTTTNRYGKTKYLKESPFAQVGSASAALHKYLLDRTPAIAGSLTGYGVVTPDCIFNISGPDIEPDVIYDGSDADSSFEQYADRLTSYWREQAMRRWSRTTNALTPTDCQDICSALMRDFDLKPSLRSSMRAVHEDLIRCTADQAATLNALRSNPRVLVRGGAGTGKTMLAVEETARLAGEGKRVLLLCYNRRLAEHLQTLNPNEDLVLVSNLHRLMAAIIDKAGLTGRIPDAQPDDLYRVFFPDLCMEALIEGTADYSFDAMVIDEGQDLLIDVYVDVLDLLLSHGIADGHWRVFMDPNQNLFSGVNLSGLSRFLDAGPTEYELTTNCRNAKEVAVTSSLLSGLPTSDVLRIAGGKADTFFTTDEQDQRRQVSKVVGRLLHQGLEASEIVILSPRKLENSCLRDGLIGNIAQLVDPAKLATAPARSVGYSTIGSFKGLEADAILLVDLRDLESDGFAAAAYVGSTRARGYLAVFLPEAERDGFEKLAVRFGELSVHAE